MFFSTVVIVWGGEKKIKTRRRWEAGASRPETVLKEKLKGQGVDTEINERSKEKSGEDGKGEGDPSEKRRGGRLTVEGRR